MQNRSLLEAIRNLEFPNYSKLRMQQSISFVNMCILIDRKSPVVVRHIEDNSMDELYLDKIVELFKLCSQCKLEGIPLEIISRLPVGQDWQKAYEVMRADEKAGEDYIRKTSEIRLVQGPTEG